MSYRGWENYVPPSREDMAARAANEIIAKILKPSKMRNVRTETGGRVFDSGREAAYFQELRLRLAAGEISQLEVKPAYALHTLTPSGEWVNVGRFTPDFRWREKNHVVMIVDVKSRVSRTEAYEMRKRHVEAEYGITITEVE